MQFPIVENKHFTRALFKHIFRVQITQQYSHY